MTTAIQLSQALEPIIANWPWFLGLFALLIVVKILDSARFKGWHGERSAAWIRAT